MTDSGASTTIFTTEDHLHDEISDAERTFEDAKGQPMIEQSKGTLTYNS